MELETSAHIHEDGWCSPRDRMCEGAEMRERVKVGKYPKKFGDHVRGGKSGFFPSLVLGYRIDLYSNYAVFVVCSANSI